MNSIHRTRFTKAKLGIFGIAFAFYLFIPVFLAAQETRTQQAATLLSKIETAQAKMKDEFGPGVFDDRASPELNGPHGSETLGVAWARLLTAAGVPGSPRDREALAKTLGPDPSASLALAAPIANLDAIEYLTRALKKVSSSPDK
jgi:hypothetical protein